LASFFNSVGVIPGSTFRETTGAALANQGVAGCKKLVDDMLQDGGGVLFIDEAYQLASAKNPGGGAVLDYLLPEVENLRGKIVFLIAGYQKQMEEFFAHNPGLPSRFPIELKFADYLDDELLRILELKVRLKHKNRMKAEDGLLGLYCRILTRRIGRGRGKDGFGNARAVENSLTAVYQRQATRIRKQRQKGTSTDDFLLTKEDLIGPEPGEALERSEAWKKLQGLVGLKSVKSSVHALLESVRQNYQRELAEEAPIQYSLNKVFLGSPGTGKTTVAKLYGQILADLGMLSKREVVVKNPADFVGSALGQSEQATKGILASSVGKVLVIDEAYGLYGGGGVGSTADPYKTAVIDTLVAEVQSVPGDDRCVLLLGYRAQMEAMFQNINPGLSRRFPLDSAFEFEDFDDDDLAIILDLKLRQAGFTATGEAKGVAKDMLSRARNRPNFGNAGEVDIILDAAKARHQKRLANKEANSPSLLEAVDFDEDFDRASRRETDTKQLFAGTVGQEDIVAKLQTYQETVRRYKSLNMDPTEAIPFSFLFRGPPGTGKTTTAAKMGKVFYDMGFLSTAEVVECSASDLVGQFVGQTGPKVLQMFDKALGKVLFIDEAYRLADGHFAKEAMDEMVDAVTKPRYFKKLIIILAGYKDDINRLMATNPGLTSRFPDVIDFRSLTPSEGLILLCKLLQKQKARMEQRSVIMDMSVLESPSRDFKDETLSLLSDLTKQQQWANARDINTLARDIFIDAMGKGNVEQDRRITVGEELVPAHLSRMLQERQSRAASVSADLLSKLGFTSPPQPSATDPTLPQNPTATTRSVTATNQETDDPSKEVVEPENFLNGEPEPPAKSRDAQRDAGVSDEVWEQLQLDRAAEQEREVEHERLVEASKKAVDDEEREKMVRQLIEEEKRRKKEMEMKKKLAASGQCPMGYEWIKQEGGYRCAGGSHFLATAQLEGL
jgi:SpoVK/Ycf46/Vps4 family AAA+-type ATPase